MLIALDSYSELLALDVLARKMPRRSQVTVHCESRKDANTAHSWLVLGTPIGICMCSLILSTILGSHVTDKRAEPRRFKCLESG